jgi:hypothetical protein
MELNPNFSITMLDGLHWGKSLFSSIGLAKVKMDVEEHYHSTGGNAKYCTITDKVAMRSNIRDFCSQM